jgi:hypothetical protein
MNMQRLALRLPIRASYQAELKKARCSMSSVIA